MALTALGALLGGLLLLGLQVTVSRELDPHAQFIVAAGFGAPVGAIVATLVIALVAGRRWPQLLAGMAGSLPGAVAGVLVGRAGLNLFGAFGVILYPLAVGISTYVGCLVANRLLSLRRQPPTSAPK